MADTAHISKTNLAPYLGGRSFEEAWESYERDGYVIFPGIIDRDAQDAFRATLSPFMKREGRNDFEGIRTNRVYGLLAKSPLFADMVMHPLALAFAEAELGASFLLSACLAINLNPGETVQPWHTDDGYVNIPLPRRACAVSAFWTIDETTEDNGATELIPGSHKWTTENPNLDVLRGALSESFQSVDGLDPEVTANIVKATMPAGSLMLTKGTLWHRGGSNTSSASRLIITPQYCAGWVRQIENLMLSTPPHIAARLPERVRELMGYSIHPPFIGYVDGTHPSRML